MPNPVTLPSSPLVSVCTHLYINYRLEGLFGASECKCSGKFINNISNINWVQKLHNTQNVFYGGFFKLGFRLYLFPNSVASSAVSWHRRWLRAWINRWIHGSMTHGAASGEAAPIGRKLTSLWPLRERVCESRFYPESLKEKLKSSRMFVAL